MNDERGPDVQTYRGLAEFRYQIRRFLRFSEEAARSAGLEPQQHQLLLSVKGLPPGTRARVGELAERLQIQHHSAVELADRLEEGGYIQRRRSDEDRREVLIILTAKAEKVLSELSMHHHEALQTYGPLLVKALKKLIVPEGPVRERRIGKKKPVLRERSARS